MKKNIFLFLYSSVIFLFLVFVENKFSVTGFCVGFLYAMIFCKKNPVVIFIPYLTLSAVFNFTLASLFYLSLSVLPAIVLCVFHFFFYKKYKLWVTLLSVIVSQTIKFILYKTYILQIAGCVIAAVFFYVCVVFLYPILVRGSEFDLSFSQRSALLVFCIAIGAGAYAIDLLPFSLYYPLLVCFLIIGSYYDKEKMLSASVAFGLGASFISASFMPLGLSMVLSFSYYVFSSVHRITGGVFMLIAYVGVVYYFKKEMIFFDVLPVATGTLLVFIPPKVFSFMTAYKQSKNGKFALRTIINRDREMLRRKLEKVSEAFDTVQKILSEEENAFPREEEIAKRIKTVCCERCTKKNVCGDTIDFGMKNLVAAALDNGKATTLDIGTSLSERCVKLPKMLYSVNEAVAAYKKLSQNRSGLAQGKEMVIAELSGTADILGTMASEIRTGFGFDTVKEARIKELLGYAGILVSDVAIYGSGNEGVTLVVRKKDAGKKEIKEVLSSVVGEELTESEKTDGVGGTVNLTFRQAPSYGLLYGESSFSAQGECGDSRQTVKLSYDKIMFILSDGMGTGAAAEETADSAVKLIKSFYLAGFDHKTVFGCVAKLLSLRKKEDFSALDVVICDTQTGEFDFIKQGGRESYVVSGGNVEVIEGCSLPLGIIEESEPQVVHRRMRGGDTVIVISDGIADRLNYNDVTELLSEIKTTNPQVIAEKVTAAAAQKEGNKDDMTAIVIRVVKNR